MTASFSRVNYSRVSRATHFFLFLLTRAAAKSTARAANIFSPPHDTVFNEMTTIESTLTAALFRSCFNTCPRLTSVCHSPLNPPSPVSDLVTFYEHNRSKSLSAYGRLRCGEVIIADTSGRHLALALSNMPSVMQSQIESYCLDKARYGLT